MKKGLVLALAAVIFPVLLLACAARTTEETLNNPQQNQPQPQYQPAPQYQPPPPGCKDRCEGDYQKCEFYCDTTSDQAELDDCNGVDFFGSGSCEFEYDECMDQCQ